jgi:FKBP-type peptidyl-prolyl cis-trans isomerase FklB
MKLKSLLLLGAVCLAATNSAQAQNAAAAQAQGQAAAAPKPVPLDKNKLSYALGYKLGLDMILTNAPVDVATVLKGVQDGYGKKEPTVKREEMGAQLYSLEDKMRSEAEVEYNKVAGANKNKSDQFMAANKTKKNIVALPSGIQYRVIEEGNGPRPTPKSEVSVHFRGSLMDGRDFESSFGGEPAKFKVDQVLPGWQEILPLMRVGDKWQVFLPPEKAYGTRAPRAIGPNQALVFEIQLLEVK